MLVFNLAPLIVSAAALGPNMSHCNYVASHSLTLSFSLTLSRSLYVYLCLPLECVLFVFSLAWPGLGVCLDCVGLTLLFGFAKLDFLATKLQLKMLFPLQLLQRKRCKLFESVLKCGMCKGLEMLE